MMTGDRLFGLVVLVIALAYLVSVSQIESGFIIDPVGPRLFPNLVGTVASVIGILIFLRPDATVEWPSKTKMVELLIILAVLVGYALTLKPGGFLVPTAIATSALSYMLNRHRLHAILTGVFLSVGLLILFKYVLGLGLYAFPRGWVG